MLSRALSLATVMLLAGCLAPEWAAAQENLDAGKSPSQLFAGTCNACHKSPRGLLRTVPASSLSSFLRQHYTTSPAMAGVLATYLISNGATDTRLGGASPKEGAREARPPASKPAAKPDEGQLPAQAAIDHGPDGRKLSAKQRLGKQGRLGVEEAPKADEAPPGETPKEASREESKPEGAMPASEGASQSAKVEEPGETPATRVDPVPEVTPAESVAPAAPSTAAAAVSPAVSAEGSEAPSVPFPSRPALPPPAVTASTPSLPPVPPAGPPVPPISQ
jgi:hypothetical protein